MPGGRWRWAAPVVLATGLAWWRLEAGPGDADAARAPPARPAPAGSSSPLPGPSTAAASAAPFSAAGAQARQAQLALWQQRLEHAQDALDAYRRSTRYPDASQPVADHADQGHPHRPVEEEHAVRLSGGLSADGLVLRTMQERIFALGEESVRFTVSLRDRSGAVQPLRIVRAWAHEVPPPRTAATHADAPLDLNDDGRAGDLAAGDGVYGMQLQPATQGFGDLFGQIRVEAALEIGGEKGFTYFDVFYTPEPPALWQGGVRESMVDGSLAFDLKAQVRQAGRYVITARVDDAHGAPFALLRFNDELAAGTQDVRLRLFGRLVRDLRPAFPLTLRDVDGFLLRESFPDRMLMPRMAGAVHRTGTPALSDFSEADWSSEERARYLAELSKDVAEAQAKVAQLAGPR